MVHHYIWRTSKWCTRKGVILNPIQSKRALCQVFLERASAAFAETPGGAPAARFEPVTVTRYDAGQFQAKHLDARISNEVRPFYDTPLHIAHH